MNEVYHKYGSIIGGVIGFYILWANDKVKINLKQAAACLLLTVFGIIFIMDPYAESQKWESWTRALCGLGIGAASQMAVILIPTAAGKILQQIIEKAQSLLDLKIASKSDEKDNP